MAKNLPRVFQNIILYWDKISSQSEFGKVLRYMSEHAILIVAFLNSG
jgi:hypothetical protein